jgi:signal transduction histidine kinase
MAATVAHEVRNPLAGISANVELLREVVSAPDDLECVDIILGEVDRLSGLVSDLLMFTRERAPREDPIDLAQVARAVCDLSQHDADEVGVELSCVGAGLACGDAELSRQALLNVVRNAIQACGAGGRVQLQVCDGQIEVTDDGPGVPSDMRDSLFDPFVTGRTRGLGLGAAVARRCLRRQRGDIVLSAAGDGGACFRFAWPVAAGALEPRA